MAQKCDRVEEPAERLRSSSGVTTDVGQGEWSWVGPRLCANLNEWKCCL